MQLEQQSLGASGMRLHGCQLLCQHDSRSRGAAERENSAGRRIGVPVRV